MRKTGTAKGKVQSLGGTNVVRDSNDNDNDNVNVNIKKCRSDLSPKRGITMSRRYPVHIPRPKSLEDLPVEVIRRIFTLGGAPGQMALLNSFFHKCLSPDKMLLSDIFWERYLLSLEHVVPRGYRYQFTLGKVLISQDLFSDDLLADFFVRYHSELIDQIDYFITDSISEKLKDQFLQSRDGKDFDSNFDLDKFIDNVKDLEDGMTDFPAYFYKNFEIYFRYPDFLSKMNRFFTFQNVSNLISDLLRWFLLEQHRGYSLNELYRVIDTACSVSTNTTKQPHLESPDPLCTILQALYCNNRQRQNTGQSWKHILRKTLNLEMESDTMRLEFIKRFLNRYYHPDRNKNARELLSDHMLWRLLKSISRVELIDLIEESGGVPQYGVII